MKHGRGQVVYRFLGLWKLEEAYEPSRGQVLCRFVGFSKL